MRRRAKGSYPQGIETLERNLDVVWTQTLLLCFISLTNFLSLSLPLCVFHFFFSCVPGTFLPLFLFPSDWLSRLSTANPLRLRLTQELMRLRLCRFFFPSLSLSCAAFYLSLSARLWPVCNIVCVNVVLG